MTQLMPQLGGRRLEFDGRPAVTKGVIPGSHMYPNWVKLARQAGPSLAAAVAVQSRHSTLVPELADRWRCP